MELSPFVMQIDPPSFELDELSKVHRDISDLSSLELRKITPSLPRFEKCTSQT